MALMMYSGTIIDVNNMSEKDIKLVDIAHHLTKICRYGGSLPFGTHYSVAAHSLNLVSYVRDSVIDYSLLKYLLLHDAAEAYIGDLVSDFKAITPDFIALDKKITDLILNKYRVKVTPVIKWVAKRYDTRILLDETKALLPKHYELMCKEYNMKPLDIDIVPDIDLDVTEAEFLSMCETLGIKD